MAPARDCGTCSLCCKLLGIGALGKPTGSWCPHCAPPAGCGIYESRPQECRDFACLWLESEALGEEWRPSRSKIVLYLVDGERLVAHVDVGSPAAWRSEPYYGQLKSWARQGMRGGPKVVVRVGERLVAILPDRDVDLGRVARGDGIFIGERMTPAGPSYVAEVIPAAAIPAQTPPS
ncbi:MAG: hypothetical protein IT337_14475 [Thermomicrobiales bacterium]|nr:hypothetical protein [Thermomicrobiales bacterium]